MRGNIISERASNTVIPGNYLKSGMRELRIPRNFPKKPVGVGEVTRIPTPVRARTRLHDATTLGRDFLQQLIHFCRRAHVVRQREAGKSRSRRRHSGIRRQQLARVQRQPGLAEFEKSYFGRCGYPGKAQYLFVKARRALEVGDAEGYEAEAGFHVIRLLCLLEDADDKQQQCSPDSGHHD